MCVQVCKDGTHHGIAPSSVDATGLQSHSDCWLLLKVLVRTLFSLILALCLVFVMVYHHQNGEKNLDQHPHQEYQFGKGHGYEFPALNLYGDSEENKNPVHLKGDYSYLRQKVEPFSYHLEKSINFHSSTDDTIKQHQNVDGVVAPVTVEVLSSCTHISTSNSAVSNKLLKKTRSKLRTSSSPKTSSFVKILQDLLHEGLLKLHHKILCVDTHPDKVVVALKRRGFDNAQGFNLLPALSNPERTQRNTIKENLADQTFECTQRNTIKENLADHSFDFVFTRMFDRVSFPALFVEQIERTLKIGGFAAMHVSLNMWRNKYISSERGHGIKPVTLLFKHSEIVYVSTAYAPGLDTIIVFKKVAHVVARGSKTNRKNLHDNALIHLDSLEASAKYKYRKWAEEHQRQSLRYIPKLWDIGLGGMPTWSATRPTHDEVVVKKSMPTINLQTLIESLNFVAWLKKAVV